MNMSPIIAITILMTAAPILAAAPKAKISEAKAQATALALVKNGSVKSHELEREHGKLIYSFDTPSPAPGE